MHYESWNLLDWYIEKGLQTKLIATDCNSYIYVLCCALNKNQGQHNQWSLYRITFLPKYSQYLYVGYKHSEHQEASEHHVTSVCKCFHLPPSDLPWLSCCTFGSKVILLLFIIFVVIGSVKIIGLSHVNLIISSHPRLYCHFPNLIKDFWWLSTTLQHLLNSVHTQLEQSENFAS